MKPIDYLKKLENNGYTAYIVGGYVRDKLLGIKSYDVDIITNAHPNKIKEIFNIEKEDKIGSVNIKDEQYNIDITTFRKESKYRGHTPKKVKYIDNLYKDLKRRDFTINTICLNSNNEYIDMLNGIEDLNKKEIKIVGRISKKISEDPLRILRAFRFAICYNFKIDDKILNYIIKHRYMIDNISNDRKREELDRIFESKNCIDGLIFLNNIDLLDKLDIKISSNMKWSNDKDFIWAQIDYKNYNMDNDRKNRIDLIKNLLSIDKYDEKVLYEYGYDLVKEVIEFKGISINIDKIYDKMNIHKDEELSINGNDIISILNITDGKKIKMIKDDLISNLASGNLFNEKKILIEYIKKKWK